jgi:hypothetical protein
LSHPKLVGSSTASRGWRASPTPNRNSHFYNGGGNTAGDNGLTQLRRYLPGTWGISTVIHSVHDTRTSDDRIQEQDWMEKETGLHDRVVDDTIHRIHHFNSLGEENSDDEDTLRQSTAPSSETRHSTDGAGTEACGSNDDASPKGGLEIRKTTEVTTVREWRTAGDDLEAGVVATAGAGVTENGETKFPFGPRT